jgi:hypothetical protein
MDMKAEITVDGSRVTIAYEDGYTVRLDVAPDSIVLRRHLGLPDPEEVDDGTREKRES